MTPRETIYAALYALVKTTAGFTADTNTSRKFRPRQDVDAQGGPWLYQVEHQEVVTPTGGLPAIERLQADIFIYALNQGGNLQAGTPGAIALNGLIQAVKDKLAPNAATLRLTLGGIVSNCYIKGEIVIDQGDLGQWSQAMIPVEIVANL